MYLSLLDPELKALRWEDIDYYLAKQDIKKITG